MPDPTHSLPADPPASDVTPSLAGAEPSTQDDWQGTPERSGGPTADQPILPEYDLREEVGRGGMGVVYRARDRRLSRDVAVKLLQDKYPTDSAAARRFFDEAKITGQLQHPGIPAVHELGALPDGRPFLAMKLIKGDTLADLLRERPDPAADRGRFVAIFEQVCQAVGYAHSRGIIHRDLKPQNVMVGAFGEVQVMDWGLAKVLMNPEPASAGPADNPDLVSTVIRPTRGADGATQAGSLLGTPAFMPPEQAIGAVDEVDARSDVFGLGAILCAILTGQPPYVGADAESTRKLAARAKLDDAFARLDGSGAEPDLAALCRRCLSAEKADRPADGGEVAAVVAGLRAAAEDRAKRAEVDRERAAVRAAEEQKRRRVVLAAAVLAVAAGMAGWQAVRAMNAEAATATQLGLTSQAEEAARLEATKARAAEEVAREEARKAREAGAAADAARAEAVAREQKEKTARTTAEQVANFMQEVFAGENPRGEAGRARDANRERTVQSAMNDAAKKIAGRFGDRPEMEAAVRETIGQTYTELGAYAEARPQLERALALREKALGPDHPSTLTSVHNLALLYFEARRYGEAVPLLDRAARGYARRPEMARAVPLIRSYLGLSLLGDGRPAEAEPHLRFGYDSLSKQPVLNDQNRNRLRWVTAGLVEVSERTNRPGQALVWRWRLAKLPPEVAPPPRAVR